jgi:hypothetical protein
MNEEIKIGPDDTWVITIPLAEDGATKWEGDAIKAIQDFAIREGVRQPLIIFGATVHIIPKETS